MVAWSVGVAENVGTRKPVVVVGHGQEQVRSELGDRADYVVQNERLGTGHAVMPAQDTLMGQSDVVIVTYADMPLLRAGTILQLVHLFAQESTETKPAIAMLTITREDAQGFGRIVRDGEGRVLSIVEEAACSPDELAIQELNPGIYCFDADWLWDNLHNIPLSAKGEYYLTDMVGIAVDQGRRVVTAPAPLEEVNGINTRIHLAEATQVLRRRILEQHMLNGVTIVDPNATYIDDGIQIGRDTTIYPGSILQGTTKIGEHAIIGPHSQIIDSMLGNRCRVIYSVIEKAIMDDESEIGPFGHLRKGAHLGRGAHMGNFGEMKNSYLGPGAKMGHFSYLGDATIGPNVNIGAGTITCNYDGLQKYPTTIGAGAFIGSDTMLVAPVEIGDMARTGAGSVVTHDVAANQTVYGVPARPAGSHQRNEGQDQGPTGENSGT